MTEGTDEELNELVDTIDYEFEVVSYKAQKNRLAVGFFIRNLVETCGIEPQTSSLPAKRSPS